MQKVKHLIKQEGLYLFTILTTVHCKFNLDDDFHNNSIFPTDIYVRGRAEKFKVWL